VDSAGDITQVLLNWENNREAALERLIPVVYAELRSIASSHLRHERPDHTMQPTALIHEAYIRLVRQDVTTWKDRSHFFGIASRIMRQILVEYARKRATLKRGANSNVAVSGDFLDGKIGVGPGNFEVILDLDSALSRMAEWDARKLEIVELHYFGGLKAEEICEALDLSLPTVRRDLLLGRAWLREQMS